MIRQIVVALALGGSSLAAQQPALVGSWKISYPGDLRMRNGVLDPIMVTGTLRVQAIGDSLVANLDTDSTPELPARPALRLATKADTGGVVFVSRSRAMLTLNGSEREVISVSTWKFEAIGDALKGSLERTLEGINGRTHGPQPVTGTRRRE